MGRHVHRLSEKDFVAKTAVCVVDGPVDLMVYGNTYQCAVVYKESRRLRDGARRKKVRLKGMVCERCGFQALDPCQIDLDHRDGEPSNNEDENLWSLCANCHRLKTYVPELFGPLPDGQG